MPGPIQTPLGSGDFVYSALNAIVTEGEHQFGDVSAPRDVIDAWLRDQEAAREEWWTRRARVGLAWKGQLRVGQRLVMETGKPARIEPYWPEPRRTGGDW